MENNIMSKTDRSRVTGFLHADGRKLVNGRGEEILLTGWGLGNWLNPEGYMWLSSSNSFDRGRNMEETICFLTDPDYAKSFWKRYREVYIQEDDIRAMADYGYNSVRIPINWRLFMEEQPGNIVWKDEGFQLLDRCISWCRQYGLYAFIDMHAAPGGQTGSNIDDSEKNLPELFMSRDYYEKALELWKKLASIYADDETVGGYDILNEPIMPNDGNTFDRYLPELKQFYRNVTAVIRSLDQHHLLSLEGHHWATDPAVFDELYDPNMVIHFHRYACYPEKESIQPYLEAADRLQVPLWLGESGENKVTWYSGYYPMMLSYGIGYNLWTWKKMETVNSPCSIEKPEGWDKLIAFIEGGERPSAAETKDILEHFLENIAYSACQKNENVADYAFRRRQCSVRATDYDLVNEHHEPAYRGLSDSTCNEFRKETGIQMFEERPAGEKEFAFDTGWDRFGIVLHPGEYVEYTFYDVRDGERLRVCGRKGLENLRIEKDGRPVEVTVVESEEPDQRREAVTGPLRPEPVTRFRLFACEEGRPVEAAVLIMQ